MSCRFKGHTLELLYAHEYTQGERAWERGYFIKYTQLLVFKILRDTERVHGVRAIAPLTLLSQHNEKSRALGVLFMSAARERTSVQDFATTVERMAGSYGPQSHRCKGVARQSSLP